MIIYRALNRVTGKSYVGQTRRPLYERRAGHYCRAKNSPEAGGVFAAAIRKYGRDAFEWEVLEVVQSEADLDEADLDEAERRWIAELNTVSPNGYNLEPGGTDKKIVHSETRRKIGLKRKGQRHSPEALSLMSESARRRDPAGRAQAIVSRQQTLARLHREERERFLALDPTWPY